MAIITADVQYSRTKHGLLDDSSLQNSYSEALAWAKDEFSNAAVGQYIFIENDDIIDGKTYAKGPYIVDAIGVNASLTPLSKGLAGETNLTDKVADLNTKVGQLETDLSDVAADAEDALAAIGVKGDDTKESTGLYAEIEAVAEAINGIEVPVTDVQVNGETVVGEGGVANIDMATILTPYATSESIAETYATQASLNDYAKADDVYTKGDANTAIADAIADLDVAGVGVAGKYVSDVAQVDGKIQVTLTDLPTVEIPEYEIVKASEAEGDNAHTYYLTKDGDKVGVSINIPKDMMVQEGSVVTLAEGEVDGKAAGTYIKLVLANSDNDPLYIAATDLIDVYTSGNKYITVSGYTITFDYDTLVNDLKSSLASTFDAAGTASELVSDAVADVNKTLEDYAKTADVNASIKDVSDKNKAQDDRLAALEELVTGGNVGDGESGEEDQTLVQKVNANKIAIAALESTVGKAADGENPATGLVATTIDLDTRVVSLEENAITAIKVNNIDIPVSDNTASIPLITDLLNIENEEYAVSAGAVIAVIDDINVAVAGKASISLVEELPLEGDSTVIYLEKATDGKITEKIYLTDGTYHILGSDLYASKAEATQKVAGLMSAADKTKLDSIETISSTELDNIFNKKSE